MSGVQILPMRKPRKLPKALRRPTYIRDWRKKAGLTLEEMVEALAHRVGYEISDGQLSRIERGESPYTQDVLEAIAAVLQVQSFVLLSHPPEREDEAENVLRLMTEQEKRQAAAVLRALKSRA